MQLKLWHKVTIVILVPLALELMLVPVFSSILLDLEKQNSEQQHALTIIEQARTVSREVADFGAALSGYTITREPLYKERATSIEKSIREHVKTLGGDSQLPPGSSIEIKQLRQKLREVPGLISRISEPLDRGGDINTFSKIGAFKQVSALQQSLISNLDSLINYEQQTSEHASRESQKLRQWLESAAIWGIGSQILIVIIVVVGFSKHLSSSFSRLMDNAYSLVSSRNLRPQIQGSDEIAVFDQALHSVASILAATQRKERAMIDNALDVICSLNADGKITDVSTSCETMLGYTQSELIGMRVVELAVEDSTTLLAAFDATRAAGILLRVEAKLKTKSGAIVDTSWSGSFSKEDNALFCVVHDITQRKHLERLKQDFVAMLTHDLRSPLTSLSASIQLMESGVFGDLNERGTNAVPKMQTVLKRLILMINDLLDIEKLESGTLEINCKNLAFKDVAAEAIESVRSLADRSGVSVKAPNTEISMYCDDSRIVRVLVNLISNGIKFSPSGSSIVVQAEEKDNCVEVSVSDHGRGIPDEKQELIFQRFKQLEREDESVKKGSGLGLAICKAIVHAHGGTIGVTSKVDEGSTFWFTLPKLNPTQSKFVATNPVIATHESDARQER